MSMMDDMHDFAGEVTELLQLNSILKNSGPEAYLVTKKTDLLDDYFSEKCCSSPPQAFLCISNCLEIDFQIGIRLFRIRKEFMTKRNL